MNRGTLYKIYLILESFEASQFSVFFNNFLEGMRPCFRLFLSTAAFIQDWITFSFCNGMSILREEIASVCTSVLSYNLYSSSLIMQGIAKDIVENILRANVSMYQTNSGKSPKFVSTSTFIFCSPLCSNNCGVVFLRKYIFVFEKWLFSFERSNVQIFAVNITRVTWPHVTNVLHLRYFCEHNPLFYHLNLIPCRYWSWQRNIYFLVNIFVRHTSPMSKSSIKTKTVLTMTNMTKSTELQAFIRQKDGYKVTVKISLCICVDLSIYRRWWNKDFSTGGKYCTPANSQRARG